MKNIKISIILALAAVLATSACVPDEPAMEPGTFEIDEQYLAFDFSNGQETVFIPIRTNIPAYEWECSSTAPEWCKLAANYGKDTGLTLAVPASEEAKVRIATATVKAGGKEYSIRVRQLGYGPAILVSDQNISADASTLRLNVVSNIDYTVSDPILNEETDEKGWFSRSTDIQTTKSFASEVLPYKVLSNGTPYTRKAELRFTPVDPQYVDRAATTCTITQNYTELSPTASASRTDSEVSVRSVTASATQGTGSTYQASNVIDGLWATSWQSPWSANSWPVSLEFTFDQTYDIDYILLTNARSVDSSEEVAAADKGTGHGNGRPGIYKIYYKATSSDEYTELCDGDLEKSGGYKVQLNFPQTLIKPYAIKIEFSSGSNNSISIAEMSFWTSLRSDMNTVIAKVFTDLSCSELKPGVTRNDIDELFTYSPYLAQYGAAAMLQGSYPESEREFRVSEYDAYSDSKVHQQAITRIYTSMDNPTGIHVNSGDEIMICVDRIPEGHDVYMATYGDTDNGYEPNYGGGDAESESWGQRQPLLAGVNVYTSNTEGMLYVLNTAKPLRADSPSIKVHILPGCGDVQGYFDLAKDKATDGRFSSLISACTYKYFMLKGEKIMFNLHTSELRNYTQAQIVSGIEAWDNIVKWQHELMGIDKMVSYNNHMMAISTTQSSAYMDAANRRVRFATDQLYRIIDGEVFLSSEDNAWGPAHELGHCNQFAINWRGCSESSNNLFSNYTHYMFGKYASRGSKLEKLALSWTKKENFEVSGEEGSSRSEDTNLHMRLNWQLWTYFHLAKEDKEFWPTVFANLRENRIPNGEINTTEDIGKGMMIYVEQVCDAAQLDLTEFFEIWGFFVPIDQNISQYGTARCTITETMVQDLKAKIAAKDYSSKPVPPIQYIEDRNVVGTERYCDYGYYEVFRDDLKISGTPSYTVSGRQYTMSGCTNAAAIELRKPGATDGELGELVYFSNMSGFVVPDTVADADLADIQVYAVQADGERIRANN